ncbi:hypothetical protein ABT144_10975 [Streptomyces sp. NPDC002039]|uniref:hypothetical protein n=1 Tax=Streptomyces sp. NPDC002039 TaxID=3154660 RepID=UPI00331FB491
MLLPGDPGGQWKSASLIPAGVSSPASGCFHPSRVAFRAVIAALAASRSFWYAAASGVCSQ